jgi:hypothetical protein
MRTITPQVFEFNELSDSAKEKAREWWRTDLPFDTEHIIDDAADIADMFGLDIRQTLKTRADNTYHWAPTVYWSGFWNQGDGASFDGSYKYKAGGLKAVKAHAPKDETLHRIVQRLQEVQRRYFYAVTARIKQNGRYSHEMTMEIDVTHRDYREVKRDDEEEIIDCLRDFARWIYRRLEAEYEYQNSDEVVDETIIINAYEFDEDGNRI